MKFVFVLSCLLTAMAAQGSWIAQNSGTKVQFRGLSAPSAKVCWAAGAMGTFARTVDGIHWTSHQIPGLEKLTFRSVVAWDAEHATLLAIGAGDLSRIYHTNDGGKKWTLQFKNPDPKAFYDCIQFWDRLHGIAMSDPVDGSFRIITTDDGGKNWKVQPSAGMPPALTGEGAFAASGTCLVVHGSRQAWFATGGAEVTRVFRSGDRGRNWKVSETPIPAGKQTAGIFGLAFGSDREGIAVGGDYKDPTNGSFQISVTHDGGQSWLQTGSMAAGLLECAAYIHPDLMLLVGPNLQILKPKGQWHPIPNPPVGVHTAAFAEGVGWAAGDGGLILKWRP